MEQNQKVELFILGLLRGSKLNNIKKYINNYAHTIPSLLTNENKTLISSIYYLLNIPEDLINQNILIWYNKFKNKKMNYKYYLEDFWKCDLKTFIEEYDNFLDTQKSIIFFRKNIINYAILLCKLKTYNIKNYNSKIKTYNYLSLIIYLIKALSYKYNDVFNFYKKFIEFILSYRIKKNKKKNFFIKDWFDIFKKNDLFLFLSLNIVKDYTYARTQYTKFCVSTTNPKTAVHGAFSSISSKIFHDFSQHYVIERKMCFNEENKINFLKYIKLLSNDYILLNILHVFYHEVYITKFSDLNFTIHNLIESIIEYKKNNNIGGVSLPYNSKYTLIKSLFLVIQIFIKENLFKFINKSNNKSNNKLNNSLNIDNIYKHKLIQSILNNEKFDIGDNIIYEINDTIINNI